MENIFWKGLELVIFDVDGTLYRQSSLRKVMLFKLLSYYAIRPWRYKELFILYHFRKEREKRSGFEGENLDDEQYAWCAEKTGEQPAEVKRVINHWIFNAPNPYLKDAMFAGVAQFFDDLKAQGIKIAIYSDYNSEEKLRMMGLNADFEISSTDKRVNSFKPLPKGLFVVLSALNVNNKENCLFIGDRFELDGRSAEKAGIPFLLIEQNSAENGFYTKLSNYLIQARS